MARDLVKCSHTRQDRILLKTKRRRLAKEHFHNDSGTLLQYNNFDNGIVLSGSACIMSQTEQVTRAKILQALKCVNSNLPLQMAMIFDAFRHSQILKLKSINVKTKPR